MTLMTVLVAWTTGSVPIALLCGWMMRDRAHDEATPARKPVPAGRISVGGGRSAMPGMLLR